mgnify:FL=1
MLEQVLIETVLGALTGYVTNDIALKQLFRDGGFIEQEKDEFIEALLVLLRDEIFTEEQIERILSTKEVEEALYQLSYKFLDRGLEEGFSQLTLKDFPNHQKAKSILIKYLNRKGDTQTEPLINIKGIHSNFINLIKSEEFSLAIDKLLMHFAGESFKEALGESRYDTLIIKQLSNEVFFKEEYLQEKISDFYDALLASNLQLKQYISITPEQMSLTVTSLLREVLTNLQEADLTNLMEKISNYNDGALIEAFKAIENQWLSNIASAFIVPLSAREDKLARLLYESVQEATEDLGESISSSILQTVQGHLAPNWLEREVLPKILQLDLTGKPEKVINQFRENLTNYLSTDAFADEVNQLCLIFLNSSIASFANLSTRSFNSTPV